VGRGANLGGRRAPRLAEGRQVIRQGLSGAALRAGHDLFRGALAHQVAAAVAAFRPQVQDPVGAADQVQVVLDHQQRVALRQQVVEGPQQLGDVVEVQARGGLIEQKQQGLGPPAPARGLGQVPRQLQPLGLAAAQGGHRLAQTQVAQPHRLQRGQRLCYLFVGGEEGQGLGHRQRQHPGHGQGLAAAVGQQLHLQHVGAVTLTVAGRAAQVDVAEELHLHVLEAGAAAFRAAALAGVEAEGAGGVLALPGQGFGGEQLADRVQGAHIAGRVGAGGLADGGLIHQHQVGEPLVARDIGVAARRLHRPAQPLADTPVDHVFQQGGLAAAADPCEADQAVQRDAQVDALEIVLGRPRHGQKTLRRGFFRVRCWAIDALLAAQVLGGK
jgi:hypothetical protein